jgi:arginase
MKQELKLAMQTGTAVRRNMQRRNFLKLTAGSALGFAWPPRNDSVARFTSANSNKATSSGMSLAGSSDRTYHLLGVPLRSGSLYPGNENDAQAYRDAKLAARLQAAGCKVSDDGDVAIPSYLPHHSVPPIRNWPGPRIAWEFIRNRVSPILQQPAQVPLLIGCDCSVVVGTVAALEAEQAQNLHIIYVDGDFDDAAPRADLSQSAAACAVWLLTHESPFCVGPPLRPAQVTVVGWSTPSKFNPPSVPSVSAADIRQTGPRESAHKILATIPATAQILLHLDIDVFQKQELSAAYFPHDQGLTLAEGRELLGVLLQDPRIRIIEISEYATLRDLDQANINKLVDLLVATLI